MPPIGPTDKGLPKVRAERATESPGQVVRAKAAEPDATDAFVDQHRTPADPPQAMGDSPAASPLFPLGQALASRSVPYTDKRAVPGAPGGALDEGHYLLTGELAPGDLPYPSRLRDPLQQRPALPESLDALAQANVTMTDVILVSTSHSGGEALVRLCELDGEPVASKTYPDDESGDARMLQEARVAGFLSDLGIGPRLRGVFRDASGLWHVVTDIVPGDFTQMPVTRETLQDCEAILARLKAVGIENLGGDFQVYRTPEGRLLVIDGGGLLDNIGHPDITGTTAASFRVRLLVEANPDVVQGYLERLSRRDPEGFASLRSFLTRPWHSPPYQRVWEIIERVVGQGG